jgi:small subunit ribosomal protein S9
LASTENYATGRRKTASARVFLRPGTGSITVNHREFQNFFPNESTRTQVKRPLAVTETTEQFDVLATVSGGGINGQAGAVRLGIARALVEFNAEHRKLLKKDGLLTSDSRVKERKKYGLAGARKRFQFSKR